MIPPGAGGSALPVVYCHHLECACLGRRRPTLQPSQQSRDRRLRDTSTRPSARGQVGAALDPPHHLAATGASQVKRRPACRTASSCKFWIEVQARPLQRRARGQAACGCGPIGVARWTHDIAVVLSGSFHYGCRLVCGRSLPSSLMPVPGGEN